MYGVDFGAQSPGVKDSMFYLKDQVIFDYNQKTNKLIQKPIFH